MIDNKKNKSNILFLFLLVLSFFLMFFNNSHFLYLIKNEISLFFFQSQERLSVLSNQNQLNSFSAIFNIYKENLILKKKVEILQSIGIRNVLLEKENVTLKNILLLNSTLENRAINAKIILRNLYDWNSYFFINKGTNNGIEKGDIAVYYNKSHMFLVGQVVESFNGYSKVLLITSLKSNIISFVPRIGSYFLVVGENNALNLKKIYSYYRLKNGDYVFTSGLGSVFPSNIYIGKIRIIGNEIKVIPDNSIYSLSYISIIKQNGCLK